jgi:Tol biopolymer transport system component
MSATRMLTPGRRPARLRRVLLMGLAGGAIAATCIAIAAVTRAAVTGAAAGPEPAASVESGSWIAYSTAPANGQWARRGGDAYLRLQGSDVYLARADSEPRLVAGRGDGTTWNVCPAFSPDGTMLAFGTKSPKRRAVRVVGVTQTGAIVAPSVTLKLKGRGNALCPRWSADGSRLAYLDRRRVVVRGLDGSFPRPRAGDPAAGHFRRNRSVLVSPTGDRVARLAGCAVTVTRLDGSKPRDLDVGLGCPYALAGWSPDGRELLIMRVVAGEVAFAMLAVPVDAQAELRFLDKVPDRLRVGSAVVVAAGVRVNHGRSWPGHGDVSWQPSASS